MTSSLRDDLVAVHQKLLLVEEGVDALVERIVRKLRICDTSELLIGRGEDRAEQMAVAGWIAAQLGIVARERTVVIRSEIIAAMLATMGQSTEDGVALACRLKKWPSSIVRLVACSRERINGLGEPAGRSEDRLSKSSQRVAIAFESASRLLAANGIADEAIEMFHNDAKQNYWAKDLVADVSPLLMHLHEVYRERRLAPVRARTFRISEAHAVRAPHLLERAKKRQRIARRHISHGPISTRRPASARVRGTSVSRAAVKQ